MTWTVGISIFAFLTWMEGAEPRDKLWIHFAFFIWPFFPVSYLNYYLKNRFLDQRKYGIYILFLPVQIIFGVALYQFGYLFYPEAYEPLIRDAFNVSLILLLSTSMIYFKRGLVNQYQLQELKAKSAENELNSLKAQINPHFLFNNLNNIYSINQMDSQKGSEMILELAEVMRYHLQFSKQSYVSISSEFQLIQSYIELEKLRLKNNCTLNIQIKEGDDNHKIAPLLLLPFVENAFKHGTHPTQDCFINLTIEIENGRLYFSINNSLIKNKRVVKAHVGLKNTKRRLFLLYPDRHSLKIKSDEATYQVKLEIDL